MRQVTKFWARPDRNGPSEYPFRVHAVGAHSEPRQPVRGAHTLPVRGAWAGPTSPQSGWWRYEACVDDGHRVTGREGLSVARADADAC